MVKQDYYQLLDVVKSASAQDIKKAYREAARKFHPDRNPGDTAAEERFKEISEAYEILSDAHTRKQYDTFGHQGVHGADGFTPPDLGAIGEMFEGFVAEVFKPQHRQARHLTYELWITLSEAITGCKKTIEIKRPIPCRHCHGIGGEPKAGTERCTTCDGLGKTKNKGFFAREKDCSKCDGRGERYLTPCHICLGRQFIQEQQSLSVQVPAGVKHGAVRTLKGSGEQTRQETGDLHITIKIKEDDFFQRNGSDISCEVPIKFQQAIRGDKINVPTPYGTVELKIPEGIQSGTVLRLRGKGAPSLAGVGKGDQLITIRVETPNKLSEEQKSNLEAILITIDSSQYPKQEQFIKLINATQNTDNEQGS